MNYVKLLVKNIGRLELKYYNNYYNNYYNYCYYYYIFILYSYFKNKIVYIKITVSSYSNNSIKILFL